MWPGQLLLLILGEWWEISGLGLVMGREIYGLRHFSLLGVWSKNLEVSKSRLRPQPVSQMISHIIYISPSPAGNGWYTKTE